MAFDKSKKNEPKKDNEDPDRIKKVLIDDENKPTPTLLKPYSVRLPENDITALQAHFEDKGLKLGQGLRMIIKAYMRKEGV